MVRVAVVVAGVLIAAGPAWAQGVAFDAASSGGGTGNALSFTHAVGTGPARFLVLGVALQPASASVSSASFGGKALSRIGARSGGSCRTELWGLVAPASGSQAVKLTLSGSPTVAVGASSYTGVNPQDPTGNYASHTGNGNAPQSLSVSVAIDANDYTVDVLCGAGAGSAPTPKAGADQTQRWRRSSGKVTGVGSTQPNTRGGRATMSWTLDGSGNIDWSISTTPLNPLPPPPPPPLPDAGPDTSPDVSADLATDSVPDALEPDASPDLADDTVPADAAEDVAEPPEAASPADAEVSPDAAPQTAEVHLRVGCACRTGGADRGGAWSLLLAIAGWIAWRRRASNGAWRTPRR
jgi:MYXO-CTERM domain-containing protein